MLPIKNQKSVDAYAGSAAKPYGWELVLDLHDCNPERFNRADFRKFFKELCRKLDMKRCQLYFWDDVGVAPEKCETATHLKGTSAVQFISTSSVVIHSLDLLRAVYLNIFSCKPYDRAAAEEYCRFFFEAKAGTARFMERI